MCLYVFYSYTYLEISRHPGNLLTLIIFLNNTKVSFLRGVLHLRMFFFHVCCCYVIIVFLLGLNHIILNLLCCYGCCYHVVFFIFCIFLSYQILCQVQFVFRGYHLLLLNYVVLPKFALLIKYSMFTKIHIVISDYRFFKLKITINIDITLLLIKNNKSLSFCRK